MAVPNNNTILTGSVLPQTPPPNPSSVSTTPTNISEYINSAQTTINKPIIGAGSNASQTPLSPSIPLSSPPLPPQTPEVKPPPAPPPRPPVAPPPAPPPERLEAEDATPFNLRKFLVTKVAPAGVIVMVILMLGFYLDPLGIFNTGNEQDPFRQSNTLSADVEKLIDLSGNTSIQGTLFVNEDLTAPNVIYSLTAGDNITISGDSQRPTINASLNEADSLQTVSGRGASTSLRLTLLGGATLGDVLGLATRGEDPSGGSNGSLYYNTTSNQFRCYIDGAWRNCDTDTDTVGDSAEEFGGITLAGSTGSEQEIADGDTITIAGSNGIGTTASATDTITIALSLSSSGVTSTTSSNSGLELTSDGLSLIRGCSDGDLVKWNSSTSLWECGLDNTGGGGGSLVIQRNDTTVVGSASVIDFTTDFGVTNSPSGEANISIDYATSGITRDNQDETITNTWTFSNATPLILSSLGTEAGSNICINGDDEIVVCSGSASGEGLQGSYDDVNTITTTNNRNIEFTLGDTTLDSKFRIVSDPGTTGFMEIIRSDGAATTDPAQLLLVDNQNSLRTQAIGLKIQSASTMTNAIDLSDPEITNAINVGSNTITGSGYLITSTSSGLTVNATGSDLALTTTSSGNITATPSSATALFNVITGNLRVGTGATPNQTLNGEDGFIEGNFEVDGTSRLDGDLHLPNIATSTGNNLCINGSNIVIQCSGSGVTSVNGLSGALTIANASGSGSTITIDDAEADGATKGIAAFDDTNFTSAAGIIDTIQNINTGASPTFTGLTLSGLVTNGFVKVTSGVLSSAQYVTLSSDVTGQLPVLNGGTGATNAADARTNLSAAKSGANSDITSLSGLTTPLSVAQGGTGTNTFTANGVLYGNGTSAIQATTQGAEGQVLAANSSGVPTWTTFSGTLCATCMVTNPPSSQVVTPTGNTTGIAIRQTATVTPTADIFYVSTNDGLVKYLQVDADGLVTMDTDAVITGDLDLSGTLTLGTGAGVLKSSSGGVISSSAVNLASSEVTGTLTANKGGTGFASYTQGQILYAATTGTSLSQLGIGTDGQVLTVSASGTPAWEDPSTDVACSSCIVDDPSSTQTIAPTGQNTLGLSVRQTSTASPTNDIFNVTNSAGSTKYLQIDQDGDITIAQNVLLTALTASKVVFTNAQKELTSTGTVGIDQGGTGATTDTGARANLSAAKSGANSDITSLTGLTTALDEIYGGTGLTSYTTGDMIYASASNTLAKLAIGSSNQVMTVVGGVPTWQTIAGGAGGLCTNCLINDPSQDQVIAPTGQGTIGLGVRQTSTGSPTDDIFYVSNSAGSSKYIQVDNSGTLTFTSTGSLGLTGSNVSITGSTTTISANLTLTSITSGALRVNGSGVVSAGDITLGTDTAGNYIATLTAGDGLVFSSGAGTGEGATPTLAIGAGNGITLSADAITLDVTTTGTTLTTSANSGLENTSAGLSLLRGCSSNQILKWNSGTEVWACAADAANAGTLTGSGSVGRLAKFNTSTDLDNSLFFQANNLMGIGTDFLASSVEPTNFLHLSTGNTSSNTVLDVMRIDRSLSTGTAAAGLGAGLVFGLESGSGSMVDSGGLRYLFTTATGGSEAADLVFQNIVGGSLAESLRVTSDKRLRLGAKGTTGDPASCTVGDIYFNSSDGVFKGCTATNTWDAFGSAGGANTALSNLSAVAINASLLPGTDDSIDLGDNTHRWRDLYLGGETLHIGTSTTDEALMSYTTSTNILSFSTDSTSNGDIAFFTDDLYLDKSAGSIGIGTTTPNEALTIDGSISLTNDGSAPIATSGFTKIFALATAGGDAIDAETVLLLEGNGTNGSTTFTDSADVPNTVTAVGNAQLDTTVKKFGTASIEFDGSGDAFTVPDSANWDFGSGSFTIDTWVYFNGAPGSSAVLYGQDNGGAVHSPLTIYIDSSKNITAYSSSTGGSWDVFNGTPLCNASGLLTNSTWHHIAFVRSGTSFYTFINGTQCGSTQTMSGTLFNSTNALRMGNQFQTSGGSGMNGFFDEYRISKGSARWTSSFTPPTQQFSDPISGAEEHVYAMLSDGTQVQLDNSDGDGSPGSGQALSSISDATGVNTIDSDNYAQTWNWNTLTTETAMTIASTSITSGKLLNLTSSAASNFSGSLLDLSLSAGTGASSNTGNLLTLTNSGTANANTALYIKHYATGSGNYAFRVDDVASDTTPFTIDGTGTVTFGNNLVFSQTNPTVSLTDTGSLIFNDGTNTLFTILDQGTYGTTRWSAKATTGDPATCSAGEIYFNSNDAAFKACTATNTWEQLDNAAAGSVALSALTAATTTNTIANANNAQTWNWDTLSTETAMTIASTSITSGKLLQLSTSASSNFTGSLASISMSAGTGASSNTGSLLTLTNSGTSNNNTSLYLQHYANGTNSLALRIDDVSSDTTPFVVDRAGNVGIGTATPSQSLTVASGNIFHQMTTITAVDDHRYGNLGITDQSSGDVVVNGDYAYVVSSNWNAGSTSYLNTFDISDPANIVELSAFAIGAGGSPRAMYTNGKFLVVGYGENNNSSGVTIYDLSNPKTPASVGSIANGGSNTEVRDVFIQGKYLYFVTQQNNNTCSNSVSQGCEFQVWDISRPNNPVYLNGVDLATTTDSVYVAGKWAYVGHTSDGILTYDISDPNNLGGGTSVSTSADVFDIQAVGNYLYVATASVGGTCSGSTVTGCEVRVYSLADSGTITGIGGYDTGADVRRIKVEGRYVYASYSNAVNLLDANNITSWSSITSASDYQYQRFAVTPKALVAVPAPFTGGGGRIVTYNLQYTDISNALIGTLNTNDQIVKNQLLVQGSGDFNGGLTVGRAGLTTQGAVAINAYYGANFGTTLGRSLFSIHNSTGGNTALMTVLDDGRVGFGTSSPSSSRLVDIQGALEVNLPGTGTTNALCHTNASGTTNEEIVDCTGTPAADYMEFYPTNNDLEIGDVVAASETDQTTTEDGDSIAKLVKTTQQYQNNVIGIVSDKTKAGDFNSIGHNIKDEDYAQPLALSGRVPVKIASDSAAIAPGDFITTSAETGKAMKAEQPGMMIGKAIASWEPGTNQATVMVLVGTTYADPQNASYLASSLGVMAPNSEDFTSAEELEGNTIHSLVVSDTFKSLGQTMLANTTIAGEVTINGTLSITEDNKINVIGTLELQTSPLAEKIEAFNGLIKLEKSGSIIAKSIAVEEIKVLGGKTAGTGVIKSGTQSIVIENPLIKENSIISITPEVLIQSPLAVTAKSAGTSFKVEIPASAPSDIPFSYLIVNQE